VVCTAVLLGGCETDALVEPVEITPPKQSSIHGVDEEERLARDVYQTLHEVWRDEIFATTAGDEQGHVERVEALFHEYNLFDPSANDAPGSFSNPELQQRYDRQVAVGTQDRVQALGVGVNLEETMVALLTRVAEEVDREDIEDTYRLLLCESRNHLRRFHSEFVAAGGDYQSRDLGGPTFAALVGSPPEPCG
jgi:hypothetical protein